MTSASRFRWPNDESLLRLVVITVGMLAGCANAADPLPGGAVSASASMASEPKVITPSEPDLPGGPDGVTPSEPSASDGTAMSQFTSSPITRLPQCNQYSVTATVDGKKKPLNGEACQQPDGSWHIAEQPVGGKGVYQTVYWPPPADVTYDDVCFDGFYDYPCLYDFPFGFSIGFPVFIDVQHHFHHFVFGDQFHHFGPVGHFGPVDHFSRFGGFHDGFGGFHGGFASGFHGGFSGGGFNHK
jgi:hypothetical protein